MDIYNDNTIVFFELPWSIIKWQDTWIIQYQGVYQYTMVTIDTNCTVVLPQYWNSL